MDRKDQQNNSQTVTLADILMIFKGKLVKLLCLALVAFIIGAALGVLKTQLDMSYGADIEFHLIPGDASTHLLPLLRSDSFAEKLLLDENGLPPKEICNEKDYNAAFDAVKAAADARKYKQELTVELARIPYEINVISDAYQNIVDEYSRVSNQLNMYKSASDTATEKDPNHAAMVAKLTAQLDSIAAERLDYETNVYNPIIQKKLNMEKEYAAAVEKLNDTRDAADEALEKVLSPWRENPEVRDNIRKIKKALSFQYINATEIPKGAVITEDTENEVNSSFLIVSVTSEEGKEFTEELIGQISAITPDFVEKTVERFSKTNQARCILISTFATAKATNADSMIMDIALFAVLASVAAVAVAAVAMISKALLPAELFDKKSSKKNNKSESSPEKQ